MFYFQINNDPHVAIKEAVNLIYTHELARQGRLLFNEAQKLYEIKRENRLKESRKNFKRQISDNVAATRVQRVRSSFLSNEYDCKNKIFHVSEFFSFCVCVYICLCFEKFLVFSAFKKKLF